MDVTRARVLLVTLVGGGVLILLAAIAAACTPHMGEMWFCPPGNSDCSNPNDSAQSFDRSDAGGTFYSKGRGTQYTPSSGSVHQTSFLLRYVTPEEAHAGADGLAGTCHAAGMSFTDTDGGPAVVETDRYGNWGPTEVDMPVADGTFLACAIPVVPEHNSISGSELNVPDHVTFTITP